MNYSNHDCRVRAKTPSPAGRPRKASPTKKSRQVVRENRRLSAAGAAAAALLALAQMAAAQIVLQPNEAQSKDAKVYAFLPEMNFQSNLGVVGSGTEHSFKSLLQFDLTAIPIPAGQITLATLEIYCSAVTPMNDSGDPPAPIAGSGPGSVAVYQLMSAWTETGVTWNSFPSLAPLAADTAFIDAAGLWHTFDITTLVQDWHSGSAANFGLGIVMENPLGQVTLLDADGRTGANPDPTLAPRLIVVPEPGTGLFALAGTFVCVSRRRIARH
jgi:hypothetical protein